jgi:hypothetical protein
LLSWFSMTKEDKNRFFIPIYKAHFLWHKYIFFLVLLVYHFSFRKQPNRILCFYYFDYKL